MYHDQEVLEVTFDSIFIQDCLKENPLILDEIISNSEKRSLKKDRFVIQRSHELIRRLGTISSGGDSVIKYLVCIKPNGHIAISKLLRSTLNSDTSRLREVQYLVHNYEFEANDNAPCLDCRLLIINLSNNIVPDNRNW